jgi:drug/metabolite transporter (DMT)-like permease
MWGFDESTFHGGLIKRKLRNRLTYLHTYLPTTLHTYITYIWEQGLVASGVAMTLQGWCADRGGPVLVAAYQPLQTIIVAILSSLFLKETFYLGR